MRLPCVTCKGSDPRNCGRTFCPITAKYQTMQQVKTHITKQDFVGDAPAPFVGHFGYPRVNVGILSTPEPKEDAIRYDDPRRWGRENTQLSELMEIRGSLINAHQKSGVKEQNKTVQLAQEVAMAKRPPTMEVKLDKIPKSSMKLDAYSAPMGPRAGLVKAELTENTKIATKVEKVYSDTDLKAKDAMKQLYKGGVDENALSRMLSVGVMGSKALRKLVPTRWSITATDDMLGQDIIKELYDYNEIDYRAYTGSHLGNYFLILTLPGPWSYELFETYQPNTSWNLFSDEPACTTDFEGPFGRSAYVEETAGGYYASRLPILEHLKEKKKVGSILVLRVITGEYAVPMGVWVVREAVRKAMATPPITFADESLLMNYAKARMKKFFNLDAEYFFKRSSLLKERKQPRLTSWN